MTTHSTQEVPAVAASFDTKNFTEQLQRVLADKLSGNIEEARKTIAWSQWKEFLTHLCDSVFPTFPSSTDIDQQWHEIPQQTIAHVTLALDVIRRVIPRSPVMFWDKEFLVKLADTLMVLCDMSDTWDARNIEEKDGVVAPAVVRDSAMQTLVAILRGLGENEGPTQVERRAPAPTWKLLRMYLEGLVGVCQDLLRPELTFEFPIRVNAFSEKRLREIGPFENLNSGSPLKIVLNNTAEVPRLTSLIISVLAHVLYPSVVSEWFLSDIERKATEVLRVAYTYCTSTSCSTTLPARVKALIRLVSSIPSSTSTWMNRMLLNVPISFLRHRLLAGQDEDWELADTYFLRAMELPTFPLPSKSEFLEILGHLYEPIQFDIETEHEAQKYPNYLGLAADFVLVCLTRFDVDTVSSVQEAVKRADLGPRRQVILDIIEDRLARDNGIDMAVDATEPTPWRERFRALVEDIMAPEQASWMDDDDDEHYIQGGLVDIMQMFQRPLTSDPLPMLDKLHDLGILLQQRRGLSTAMFCASVAKYVLEGSNRAITPQVRKRVFKVLTVTALAEFVELFNKGGEVWNRIEPLFDRLYNLMGSSREVSDTVVVTAGKITKSKHPDIVAKALCFLIFQLSQKNPVIKGAVYMQIVNTARYHKKGSPFPLLQAYMDKLAPVLVNKICLERYLLAEACKVMAISTQDFLTVTLSRTVPYIVGARNQNVLDTIAKEIGSKPATILMKYAHQTLAHAFLLPTEAETNTVIEFVIQTLTAAQPNVTIDAQSIVKSCVVPLLAELVIVMGDAEPQAVQMAKVALSRVHRLLKKDGQERLGAFLKSYILGLITTINDMLQDVHGKKSIETKRMIVRSLGALVEEVGPGVSSVAPQIMATFQTMACIPDLAEATLESWHCFLVTMSPEEVGPHIGPTSAVFMAFWADFSASAREIVIQSLRYIVCELGSGDEVRKHLGELVEIPDIPELKAIRERLQELRGMVSPKEKLACILERTATDNQAMMAQGLRELKDFMLYNHPELIKDLTSGATFDPLIGRILSTVLSAASREVEEDPTQLLALECLSILGAVDIDRCELTFRDSEMIVIHNFTVEEEAQTFALHLITNVLVEAFRSTSDIKYQSHLAYAIQELLKFCSFDNALVNPGRGAVSMKIRSRWASLPKHVLETVTPFLEARYTLNQPMTPDPKYPIYPTQSTYREWIQLWTTHLISMVTGSMAEKIFGIFRSVVRNKDVVVAHSLLPHLVLNILLSGNEGNTQKIRGELRVVLEDQVDPGSVSTQEKRQLSAQAVFMILDHLNRWVRRVRQIMNKKEPKRSSRMTTDAEQQLLTVDSILSDINQDLMGKAALQCKAYARSLMNFERHILVLQERDEHHKDLSAYYEKLHEIYAHLDEPDGMEGISKKILLPSLEHQIRGHEINGRWTSAQSCWEVRIQQDPENVDYHLGLLQCLRNLGHYDTLRTHVSGLLTRQPSWQSALAGFQVEGACMVGDWENVHKIVDSNVSEAPSIVLARLLLALRSKDEEQVQQTLSRARLVFGRPVAAAGVRGYRRAYEAALNLHLTHELALIYTTINRPDSHLSQRKSISRLSRVLAARLDVTVPTFHAREAILSMRRTAFSLLGGGTPAHPSLTSETGRSWLASAKIARKAGQWQTAYSAMLQAKQRGTLFSFLENAKLLKATGEPLQALEQLENSMQLLGFIEVNANVINITDDNEDTIKAKAHLLRARWMDESERFDVASVFKAFNNATELLPDWESGHFYLGRFQDDNWKNLPQNERVTRGLKMNIYTVKAFAKAIKLGSKYVYQTVPRLLTLWLDLGDNEKVANQDMFRKINDVVDKVIKNSPMYKWYTAFPQMVSRLEHSNNNVRQILAKLIIQILAEYPKQALWLFASVTGSKNKGNPNLMRTEVPELIKKIEDITEEFLRVCNYPIPQHDSVKTMSMKRAFPRLLELGKPRGVGVLVPLQESLTASLPPTSSAEATHQPFPLDAPTFSGWLDDIEIMRSLAKPRKLTLVGNNGQIYMFLAKPKDDLRKDARLMDLNSIINKLLKGKSESRRRQLYIRTYGVVTLNEECGLIQWVPNTKPIRPILVKYYEARGIQPWSGEIRVVFDQIANGKTDHEAAEMFADKVLKTTPPVFHEWFIETFPEPTTWLTSRLNYGRTAAVMSMVGFIIGLGDRHCENILMDENTGDTIHVDFNCLFEQGKQLQTPERVPFRLTQNLVDGLGVTGYEGIFRTACEITLQLLRDNKDLLMSVLDAFIHDPLVDFAEKRHTNVRASTDLKKLARDALVPIEKKLRGLSSTVSKEKQFYDKEISTSNLVQMLIQEATDLRNLAKMYLGWAPWH
uniref:non-specific serine/threonine protein kinase n=1 Tax=Moniliophthora roreri TaxID=221103 RepID=A0A0W0G3C2_MONRR